MDNFMWILAYDGDNAGRLVGRAILSNDPKALAEVSLRINLGHEVVQKWAIEHGGSIISGGGDEGTFQVPHEALDSIEQLRADYLFATRLTMSVGVGKTLSEAGKSLIVGKFRGKNQVVFYDPTIEQEIQKVQSNLEQGIASEEEKKQGEAYLQPEVQGMNNAEQPPMNEMVSSEHDCPYCQEMQSQNIYDEDCPYCVQATGAHDPNAPDHADDCPYCAVMNHDPSAEGHSDDCPYCQEMAAHDPMSDGHADDCPYCARSHDPAAEGHPDDCKYCARAGAQAGGDDQSVTDSPPPSDILPTTQDSQDYAGQDLPRPSADKPAAISAQPSMVAPITDSKTNQNIILENEQGPRAAQEYQDQFSQGGLPTDNPANETVQDIVAEIDALPANEVPPRQQVNGHDAANEAVGSNMEGNVSRPEGYSQDVPTDLGLGEEPSGAPDITSVLQEGLDNHADNIQRERVVEMVGQALEGFKASKMILERAKTEAPQLYESSIAMLKAMIEMAKMLGLDQDQAAAPSGVLEGGPAEEHGNPVAQQADPNAVTQGDPSATDAHPDYENLFPSHPDQGGDVGEANSPKPQGQLANR